MDTENAFRPAGILAMNPEGFREIDGVVLDLESYAKHCAPPQEQAPAPAPAPSMPQDGPAPESAPAPQQEAPAPGVFLSDPVHIGWYPAGEQQVSYPIMGGEITPPVAGQAACIENEVIYTGSGSGSWVSSWLTSWRLSSGSWRAGSGSWLGSSGSYCGLQAPFIGFGGYGLELI